ncbi:MAG: D-2-hydroxyacid dehydrogenase [Sphingomonas sp.]|nr:D-2-hydroxyacid dehydrogenase [Sphingomonas sp.]
MSGRPLIVFPERYRPQLEALLPAGVDVRGFTTLDEAMALAPQAEIGWFDEFTDGIYAKAPRAAVNAKWINTILAGLDAFALDEIQAREQIFTNGAGLMPDVVADFAVLGVLTLAKRLDEVVRAHDRREWLRGAPPGDFELLGARALVIGYGAIGSEIGTRLRAFGVDVTGVRRLADPAAQIIGADDWRARLGDFDIVVLAAPSTSDTRTMIGAAELAAMKPGVRLVNIARGDLIDQGALIAALEAGQVGSAFLDVTSPEPLPADDPLWKAPNALITMHLSGRSQRSAFERGARRFVKNLRHYLAGEPLEHVVDFSRGY